LRCLSYWVYRLRGGDRRQRYFVTGNPALDAGYWQERQATITVLTPPLSIARAEHLQRLLQQLLPRDELELSVVRRELRRLGEAAAITPQPVQPGVCSAQDEARLLLELLEGRILLLEEVEQLVREQRLFFQESLPDLLQYLYLEGLIDCRAAVAEYPVQRCLRCGSRDLRQEPCLECGDTASWVCQSCRQLGQASSCSPYYAVPSQGRLERREVALRLPQPLSPAQSAASQRLLEFVVSPQRSSCLFWTVAGAGADSAVLPALQQTLAAGGRALWIRPRRDLALQLQPLLAAAFPEVRVTTTRDRMADLQIATPSQAMRRFADFDLVLLDEVAAFPDLQNPLLELVSQRAVKSSGKLIYLTATPTRDQLQQVQRGKMAEVILAARLHGQPLPQPVLQLGRLGGVREFAWPIPAGLDEFLQESMERDLSQILVVVPDDELAQQVGRALKSHFSRQRSPEWVEFVHEADDLLVSKRNRFLQGEYPILVTPPLLQRDIRLPRLNLAVLYAERDDVFTEAVLIDLAQRIGLLPEYPQGRVSFFAERRSGAMLAAVDKIRALNQLAAQPAIVSKEEA
jgi:competence protein ComFA